MAEQGQWGFESIRCTRGGQAHLYPVCPLPQRSVRTRHSTHSQVCLFIYFEFYLCLLCNICSCTVCFIQYIVSSNSLDSTCKYLQKKDLLKVLKSSVTVIPTLLNLLLLLHYFVYLWFSLDDFSVSSLHVTYLLICFAAVFPPSCSFC